MTKSCWKENRKLILCSQFLTYSYYQYLSSVRSSLETTTASTTFVCRSRLLLVRKIVSSAYLRLIIKRRLTTTSHLTPCKASRKMTSEYIYWTTEEKARSYVLLSSWLGCLQIDPTDPRIRWPFPIWISDNWNVSTRDFKHLKRSVMVHISASLFRHIQSENCFANAVTISETKMCFVPLLLAFAKNTSMDYSEESLEGVQH